MADRSVNYALRATVINAAKPKAKPYVLTDGGGLYVEVLATGSKVWRYSYRLGGSRPKLTIGSYPEIGIADARDKHAELRALVAKGVDPIRYTRETTAQREAEDRARITFASFAKQWIADTLFYRSESYRSQTIRLLDAHINPTIGEKALAEVKPAHVLTIVEALKHVPTTADRCRALIQQIFNHAIRKLLVDSNPAVAIRGVIKVPPKTHHRHLSEKELAAFWKKVGMQHTASAVTVYAVKLLMLTMVRKSELRLAKWGEFDLGARIWDIPASRMKMRSPHRVYLSEQTVNLLQELKKMSGHGEYVFPMRFLGGQGKPISDATLNHFIKRLDFGVPEFSPHGTRGTAATLLRENGFSRDVVESCGCHSPP
ncbi:tyrosine-type recombinase/integrase [Hydrogenophaga sp.]|uniref:tyrosine-type recombinase/integrase n=1 Tax=Hydrogenophaga sp. TaxID=1904254 RepID=UPI0035B172B2